MILKATAVKNALQLPTGYPEFVRELKTRIRGAQIRAAFAVNRELILLYWSVGRDIPPVFKVGNYKR